MNKPDETLDKFKEAALAEMKELASSDDYEAAHKRADAILCELLARLGHEDIAEAFGNVGKWYA